MYRVTSFLVLGALVLIPALFGCGGDSGTGSSAKGTLTIALDNRWGGRIYSDGRDFRTHVVIPASGHDFYMEPDEFKVIEVTPAEGDTMVLVKFDHIAGRPGLANPTREAQVGDGQTVIITQQFQIDVTDGIAEPERRWTKGSTWGRYVCFAQGFPRGVGSPREMLVRGGMNYVSGYFLFGLRSSRLYPSPV